MESVAKGMIFGRLKEKRKRVAADEKGSTLLYNSSNGAMRSWGGAESAGEVICLCHLQKSYASHVCALRESGFHKLGPGKCLHV